MEEKAIDLEHHNIVVQRMLIETTGGDSKKNTNLLRNSAKYLEPKHFEAVVAERALNNVCGYPLCNNTIPKRPPFRISSKEGRVYDQSDLLSYCSTNCQLASNYYKAQLSEESILYRVESEIKLPRLYAKDNENRPKVNVKKKKLLNQPSIVIKESQISAPTQLTEFTQDQTIEGYVINTPVKKINHSTKKSQQPTKQSQQSTKLIQKPIYEAQIIESETKDPKASRRTKFVFDKEPEQKKPVNELMVSPINKVTQENTEMMDIKEEVEEIEEIDKIDQYPEDYDEGVYYEDEDDDYLDLSSVKIEDMGISEFGLLSFHLTDWTTDKTIDYFKGKNVDTSNDNQELYSNVFGSAIIPSSDGVTTDLSRQQSFWTSIKPSVSTISNYLKVPQSFALGELLNLTETFNFQKSIPSFTSKQWEIVVLVLFLAMETRFCNLIKTYQKNKNDCIDKITEGSKFTKYEINILVQQINPQ